MCSISCNISRKRCGTWTVDERDVFVGRGHGEVTTYIEQMRWGDEGVDEQGGRGLSIVGLGTAKLLVGIEILEVRG